MNLPDCNFECLSPEIEEGPSCPNTSREELFPRHEVFKPGMFTGQTDVKYGTTLDILTILAEIPITIFDRDMGVEAVDWWVDAEKAEV